MANYRVITGENETRWCLMSPSNLFEAFSMAWSMWRYPERMSVLVGVKEDWFRDNVKPVAMDPQSSQLQDSEQFDEASPSSGMRACAAVIPTEKQGALEPAPKLPPTFHHGLLHTTHAKFSA